MQTNTEISTVVLNKNILGIVATACLRKTAQAPAPRRTNLNATESKRPLHSAPQDNKAKRCC